MIFDNDCNRMLGWYSWAWSPKTPALSRCISQSGVWEDVPQQLTRPLIGAIHRAFSADAMLPFNLYLLSLITISVVGFS